MADKEPTTGPQAQAPTTQQTPAQPAASKPAAPASTKAPAAKPEAAKPAAPKAATPMAPVLVMRSDPAVFDTNNVKALIEKRRKLSARRMTLVSELAQIDLDWRETEEKLRFLLAPSPIFAEGAIPGSEFLTGRMDELAAAIGTVKALVADKPTEHEVALQVERTLAPKFDALASTVGQQNALAAAGDEADEDEGVSPTVAELIEEGGPEDDLFDEDEEEGQEEAPLVEAVAPDYPWTDSYEVEGAPDLDALPLDVLTLEGVGNLTVVVIPHDKSAHIDAIGAELARKDGETKACVYVRFKQKPKAEGRPWRVSEMYRYSVLDAERWATLVDIATRRIAGGDESASIGSFIENEIKALHERGLIGCQRLDAGTGTWVNAMTRAERQAAKSGMAPAQAAAPATPTAVASRPAQPRTVPAGQRIGSLGEAMKQAATPGVAKRPTAPAQQGAGDPLDESFMG